MKNICTLFLFFSSYISSAQFNVDCNSHRFDQEVFPTVVTSNNILYGSNIDANGTNTNLIMDIYEPAGDTMVARPLIIWAHGGSFITGTKSDGDVVSLSQHFAKRGYVCASISYRLGVPFPINQESAMKAVYRSVQDMKAAIRFFRKDAAGTNIYKIDPNTVFVGGSSAGAFAALHTAYLDKYSEFPILLDTIALGTLEGSSGNPGFSSAVNAVIDLCGALGNKNYIEPGNVPFVAMHGTMDNTVPYATAIINFLNIYPIMVVDGSYSISDYANTIGVYNEMYTYFGAGHVPYLSDIAYMDTTVRFVSNFLYKYLGCNPVDPAPLPNTFSVGINSFSDNKDIVFSPNPGNGIFTINTNSFKYPVSRLLVYNINGQMVKEIIPNDKNISLDLSKNIPGIYFYQIKTKGNTYSGKLVVE